MKELDIHGLTYLRALEGTSEWYYALDYAGGDLYEAQEIYETGRTLLGSHFFLVHYPDGEVIAPLVPQENVSIGEPVYHDGKISFLEVKFAEKRIVIRQFDCSDRSLKELETIDLSSVTDCYNLKLSEHPLTLTRQPNNGTLELIWPEKKTIETDEKESFFFRDENKLFFSTWYEDPDYRVETVVRDVKTGEILEKVNGDMQIMPNGEVWHVK